MNNNKQSTQQTINKFYMSLAEAWRQEPELLESLGITEEVYDNVMNWNGEETADFFERYDEQPKEVKAVLKKYEEFQDEMDYKLCEALQKDLNAIGWDVDYELSAEPFNLRPIKKTES